MRFFSGFETGKNVIGVDIGSSAIKLAQLAPSREGIALRKAGSTLTPPGAVKNGIIVDPLGVSQAISSLLEALQVEASMAVGGVAGPAVVVRQVSLPAMSRKQLQQSIQWEARNYISFPVEDSIVEFQILPGSASENDSNLMEVMLVAAPREMVEGCAETMELAGLEPVAVEVQAFAAMRTILGMSDVHDDSTIALVGCGASFSEITIVKGQRFVLSRIIPIAGNSLTEAICSSLEVGREEGELLKETTLRAVQSEEERASLDPAAQQASRAIEPMLDELIREIRRSLAYHDYQQKLPEAETQGQGADRIILSGGSARLLGMDRYLGSQLGVPTEVADIFGPAGLEAAQENVTFLGEHAPTLVIAVGLALRELAPWRGKVRRPSRAAAQKRDPTAQEGAETLRGAPATGGRKAG